MLESFIETAKGFAHNIPAPFCALSVMSGFLLIPDTMQMLCKYMLHCIVKVVMTRKKSLLVWLWRSSLVQYWHAPSPKYF